MKIDILANNIQRLRKDKGYTQDDFAKLLNVSFQAVSKWETKQSYPDITLLPDIAQILNTTVDSLLGYVPSVRTVTEYENRYKTDEYYWGLTPSTMCYQVMQICPPVKPLRLIDIGCGEGKDAIFFARNGYDVTAFDIADSGIEKLKRLADIYNVNVNIFKANVLDFRLDDTNRFDIIYCSGVLHYIPEQLRRETFDNYKCFTNPNGIHAMNVFVTKPFIESPPDKESTDNQWISGEMFIYYHDWHFLHCSEYIFDCTSGNIPHKHCMNKLITRKAESI